MSRTAQLQLRKADSKASVGYLRNPQAIIPDVPDRMNLGRVFSRVVWRQPDFAKVDVGRAIPPQRRLTGASMTRLKGCPSSATHKVQRDLSAGSFELSVQPP